MARFGFSASSSLIRGGSGEGSFYFSCYSDQDCSSFLVLNVNCIHSCSEKDCATKAYINLGDNVTTLLIERHGRKQHVFLRKLILLAKTK